MILDKNDEAHSRHKVKEQGLALRTVLSTDKVVGNNSTDKFFPVQDLEGTSVRLIRTARSESITKTLYDIHYQVKLTIQVITSLLQSSESMRCTLAGKFLPPFFDFKNEINRFNSSVDG